MCNQSVPGIFLNMNVPSVQVLLYADDIALVNDTVGRLQACLNVLSIFCRNYGLRVNESNTKVMVIVVQTKLDSSPKYAVYSIQTGAHQT